MCITGPSEEVKTANKTPGIKAVSRKKSRELGRDHRNTYLDNVRAIHVRMCDEISVSLIMYS